MRIRYIIIHTLIMDITQCILIFSIWFIYKFIIVNIYLACLFHPKGYDSMNFAISILQQGYIGIQKLCNSRYKYFFFAKYLCSFAIVLIVVNTNIFVMISNTFETYHLWVDTENHVFENILIEMIGYNKNGFVK